ncbi:hypothetical protein PHLCEN_2v7593 [Hermanssonia centrifuga]|uniref:Checkpoint protein RAD24-like helical bundle domain-containing protein n=1 Tax=Hermanssonia centrifuga TaxID=98765 RepID=A0A2R6NWN1_9APHY|nr:hypothetical protein PHLCEN_2v7593 [Hermanssonia centrifuga]
MAPKPSAQRKTKAMSGSSTSRVSTLKLDTPGTCGPPAAKRQKLKPLSFEELAVHVKKVRDIRQWFVEAFEGGPSGRLRKYRRILALTGPAGTAKTATVRVLSRELGFDILEWRNSVDDRFSRDDDFDPDAEHRVEYEGLSEKFHNFLTRASNCRSVFGQPESKPSSLPISSQASRTNDSHISKTAKRQIILLEDLPNILHPATQEAFHTSLEALVANQSSSMSPVVIIVSDAGVRGESGEEGGPSTSWKGKGRDTVNIRTVLPPSLLMSPYVTQVSFNPIASTLMKRALQHLLTTHFSQNSGIQPSKEVLDIITESSNGDIRSAIMALQFACVRPNPGFELPEKTKGKGKSKKGNVNARMIMEAVTRREQSLALFHLIGKILYNKRKGDPPSQSASAKDRERDRGLDAKLKDPTKLPTHLREHDRKASRVDVEILYADSPIDSSLLSLYIHQNYTQYCNELDECEGVMEWLSWVDSSGGESWQQANPHRFHLLTLGTMHSLPTPVPRRNQKAYKPAFFDVLKRERESEDGIRDVHEWLRMVGPFTFLQLQHLIGLLARRFGYGMDAKRHLH